MAEINTELPLDWDYFNLNEKEDTETISEILREYNEVGGMMCEYFPLFMSDTGLDPVFLENTNKQWNDPFKVKLVHQYLEEVVESGEAGVQILDSIELSCEKEYFLEKSGDVKPKIGDLIRIPYADLMFEVTNSIDSKGVLQGQKLTWTIFCKIYHSDMSDSDITNEIYQPGEAPGESDNFDEGISDDIEALSEEGHVYSDGDNPFQNS